MRKLGKKSLENHYAGKEEHFPREEGTLLEELKQDQSGRILKSKGDEDVKHHTMKERKTALHAVVWVESHSKQNYDLIW